MEKKIFSLAIKGSCAWQVTPKQNIVKCFRHTASLGFSLLMLLRRFASLCDDPCEICDIPFASIRLSINWLFQYLLTSQSPSDERCPPVFSISASDIAHPHQPNRASTVLFLLPAHLDLFEANKGESGPLLFSVVISNKSTRIHHRLYLAVYIAHI